MRKPASMKLTDSEQEILAPSILLLDRHKVTRLHVKNSTIEFRTLRHDDHVGFAAQNTRPSYGTPELGSVTSEPVLLAQKNSSASSIRAPQLPQL